MGWGKSGCSPALSISLRKLSYVEQFGFTDGDATYLKQVLVCLFPLFYLPSHTVSSSYSLSGKKSHKSGKLSHGPNLCFLPPLDKKMFTLLANSNLYCSTKRYEVAVKSLSTALQVRLESTYIQTRQNLCS